MTWGVDFADGAIQGVHEKAFGEGIVIPALDIADFVGIVEAGPLKIDTITVDSENLAVVKTLIYEEAGKGTGMGSYLSLGQLIPFDEIVEAMYKVGRSIPFELRETAIGGLAGTKTGCDLCKSIFKD